VNWSAILDHLAATVLVEKVLRGDGHILAPAEPIALDALLLEAAESDDDREWLQNDGATTVLASRWDVQPLLNFEWNFDTPMTWFLDLYLLDVGTPRAYVYFFANALAETGEHPAHVVAAVEPKSDASLFSAFLRKCLSRNGKDFLTEFDGMFSDLPSMTTNHRPDLFPRDVVKEGYWDSMKMAEAAGDASWIDLRDEALRTATDPRILRPLREVLGERLRNVANAESRKREAAELTDDGRRRILEIHFSQAYREVVRKGGRRRPK